MPPSLQLLIPLSCILASLQASEPRDTMPDTWAATDALGRTLPMGTEVGAPRPDRTVGLFYFNWHAAFGNKQVHDIAKILKASPAAPAWGPVQAHLESASLSGAMPMPVGHWQSSLSADAARREWPTTCQ